VSYFSLLSPFTKAEKNVKYAETKQIVAGLFGVAVSSFEKGRAEATNVSTKENKKMEENRKCEKLGLQR